MAPGGRFQFNVAIRTALVDQARGELAYGVGSGVTWDSDARAEYDECLLKARVLGPRAEPFELLETLRWDPDGGYHRRAAHLSGWRPRRLTSTSPCDRSRLDAALDAAVASATDRRRVRLLVTEQGTTRTESFALTLDDQPVRACLAVSPIDDMDPFFFHKTTSRAGYFAPRCGKCDDVPLWNLRGELTESTLANIVMELDGELVTPPVESGLLAGTERAHAIAIGRIRERPVGVAELARASRLWLINSVRGWRPLVVVRHGTEPVAPAAPPFTTPGA